MLNEIEDKSDLNSSTDSGERNTNVFRLGLADKITKIPNDYADSEYGQVKQEKGSKFKMSYLSNIQSIRTIE